MLKGSEPGTSLITQLLIHMDTRMIMGIVMTMMFRTRTLHIHKLIIHTVLIPLRAKKMVNTRSVLVVDGAVRQLKFKVQKFAIPALDAGVDLDFECLL